MSTNTKKKHGTGAAVVLIVLCLLALGTLGYIIWRQFNPVVPETAAGYVAAAGTTAPVYDENGAQLGSLVRGAEVQYVAEDAEDGADRVRVVNGEGYAYLDAANLTADYSSAVLTETVYALRGMSLTDETGAVPGCAVEKGMALTVTGFDGLDENGEVLRWAVSCDRGEGYIDGENVISDLNGTPLKISSMYWPSAYNRTVWQYKVELALEAAALGFNEIQFDYIRFPDGAYKYEQAGTIDYKNTYGESKAQAVQRFLIYAAQRLHDAGYYISGDVFGECANAYVTACGQYWPAISSVVDAISGMPYPDHYSAQGDYKPWEHPYTTVHNFGESAMARQSETASPAAVRTWIQCYNAIREPYNHYGAAELADEVRALRDAGCTGGFMTWNGASDIDKYAEVISALS